MSRRYDAIVVGGGHNGLVAATRLAKAGRRTLLLEAQERLGGLAGARDLGGTLVPAGAHLLYALHPQIERALELERHGLAYASRDLGTLAVNAEGRRLALGGGGDSPDAAAWAALETRLLAYAKALAPFRAEPPPRPVGGDWGDRWALAKLGLRLRRLGRGELREFLRIVLLNVQDLLDDTLGDPLLKAALAWDALVGTHLAPRSPGGVLAWLYRLSGRAAGSAPLALPRGGVPALADALTSAARAAGVEVRASSPVARVLLDEERVRGVVLEGGEEIAAGQVLCSTDPKRTLCSFVGAPWLDTGFLRQARRLRSRGLVGKLDLLLDALPDDLAADARRGRLLLLDDLAGLEESYDGAKYGEVPAGLGGELLVPGAIDPADEPPALSLLLTYLPTQAKVGLEAARADAEAKALALLESRWPGLTGRIAAKDLWLPGDYEARLGLSGGDWHHAETTIEQLFLLRPVAGAARYATPVAGLFLCGAGAHPGGHVTGLPGWNAAAAALKDTGAKDPGAKEKAA